MACWFSSVTDVCQVSLKSSTKALALFHGRPGPRLAAGLAGLLASAGVRYVRVKHSVFTAKDVINVQRLLLQRTSVINVCVGVGGVRLQ